MTRLRLLRYTPLPSTFGGEKSDPGRRTDLSAGASTPVISLLLARGAEATMTTTWKTVAMDFTTAYDAKTLEGLPGVSLVVHLDEDDALQEVDAEEGLTVETLRTDVEFQLRLAGIRLLTEPERLLTPSGPVLSVTVGMVARADIPGVHAFALTVGLYQLATLAGGLRVSTGTWNLGNAGFAASSLVRTRVRDQVKEKTKAFVDAWLTVNRT